MQKHKQLQNMSSFTYFIPQASLTETVPLRSPAEISDYFVVVILLGLITPFIYHHWK